MVFLQTYLQVVFNSKNVLLNKKGSTMVESAIIFPLVILAAIAVIYLFINIYSQASLQANMHILIREEAGSQGDLLSVKIKDEYVRDKYRRNAESVSVEIVEKAMFGFKYFEASKSKKYLGGGLTAGKQYEMEYYGRYYAINESLIVRGKDLIGL